MDLQVIIIWLIVGAIAGWLAGMVVKGGGFGLIGDIIVGIIGALIAGWLLPRIGIVLGTGIIAAIIDAFIGAVILLIILRLVKTIAQRTECAVMQARLAACRVSLAPAEIARRRNADARCQIRPKRSLQPRPPRRHPRQSPCNRRSVRR